ncbi:MAG: DnaJ domain-containing protein [Phycisphaerales bacterium]|nr:DnaJ domain-containing protein [Phycisphaerales bacterium]
MSQRDYYDVLGVSRDASADEIKKAHRRLVRQWHPDRNKAPDAATKFAEIQEAYDNLSDPEKRKNYDRFGHTRGPAGFGGGAPGGGRTYTWSSSGQPGGFNVEDVDFGGGGDVGSIFEELFGRARRGGAAGGRRGRGAAPAARGQDISHTIDITFDTAIRGGKEPLRLSRGDQTETIEVTIPPGIADGAKLRLRGKGQPSPMGGESGDLILTIRVGKHPYYRREGNDIYLDLPITIAEGVEGATVQVPTPQGPVSLKVPPGANTGQKLRITGRGVKMSDGRSGDFYAVIAVQTPKGLSADDREFIVSLGERLPNPRRGQPWE